MLKKTNSRKMSMKMKKSLKRKSHKRQNKGKIHQRKTHRTYKKREQRGGGSCQVAMVYEPSFNLPDIGAVKGLNIDESRAVLSRDNCSTSAIGQAMVPPRFT